MSRPRHRRQAMGNPSEVARGQTWVDADPRQHGQRVLGIVAIEGEYALVEVISGEHVGRRSRVRLDRFRPNHTGYRLIS